MSSLEDFTIDLRNDEEAAAEVIDYRMITFTLGGRDYGFDIMVVKEISKVSSFTYVPNTAAYVRGVHNLRGEIISVIDLRVMFHLPIPEMPEGEPEDVLFLESGDHLVGVIVDRINDVVGVSSERIQTAHPLFDDINLRYISGVVESRDTLYVILDAAVIFGDEMHVEPPRQLERRITPETAAPTVEAPAEELDFTFVQESLEAFKSFHVCELNERWAHERFAEWTRVRSEEKASAQLKDPHDADRFLATFYSPHAGDFWGSDYLAGVVDLLPAVESSKISAWVIGTGEGREAYSLACAMKMRYPEASLTIWAHDSDLLKISSAPTLVVDPEQIAPEIRKHLVETPRGYLFSEEIRNSIYFEYHDVGHENTFPDVQAIVVRDFLSFQNEAARDKLLTDIADRRAPGAVVFPGHHEEFVGPEWELIESHGVRAYR